MEEVDGPCYRGPVVYEPDGLEGMGCSSFTCTEGQQTGSGRGVTGVGEGVDGEGDGDGDGDGGGFDPVEEDHVDLSIWAYGVEGVDGVLPSFLRHGLPQAFNH